MRYRLLGRTGLSVSEIGFGCANYGDTSALQPAHDACSAGAKTG